MTRMWKSGLCAVALCGSLATCSPYVEVIDIDKAQAEQLRKEIKILAPAAVPRDFNYLGPISATSCKYYLWDESASNYDAINQLLYNSKKMGGDAITDLICGVVSGVDTRKNCWSSVTCYANSVNIGHGADGGDRIAGDNGTEKKSKVLSGTGFYVSAEGHILTNQHVIEDCRQLTINPVGKPQRRATIMASDSANDLAILLSSGYNREYAAFPVRDDYKLGDDVVTFGFPLAGTFLSMTGNLTTGTISALAGVGDDSRFIQISAPVQAGNSGGPLSDQYGRVIGVVTSKLNALSVISRTGDFPQNVNFAVKETFAKTFLKTHAVPFKEEARKISYTPSQIADQLKKYTVYIQCMT